jgi:hypothetical protein
MKPSVLQSELSDNGHAQSMPPLAPVLPAWARAHALLANYITLLGVAHHDSNVPKSSLRQTHVRHPTHHMNMGGCGVGLGSPGLVCGPGSRLARAVALLDTC